MLLTTLKVIQQILLTLKFYKATLFFSYLSESMMRTLFFSENWYRLFTGAPI